MTLTDPAASPPGAFVESLSWPQVAERLGRGDVAVLPVGAAAKEHGPHLPMGTDATAARWLAAALCERRRVLVWPVVGYGHYPAFVHYAGSLSLSRSTFEATVRELVDALLGFGARGVLVLNTGISTIGPTERALTACSEPARVRACNVYASERFEQARRAVATQRHGTHADEIETSVMLAIAPDVVRMADAPRWDVQRKGPGPFRPDRPDDPSYSPSGVYGDATAAHVDKGRVVLAAMLGSLEAELDDMQTLPPVRKA